MIHGRGSNGRDMLGLISHFPFDNFAYLMPNAANSTWYPNSFLAPIQDNQPGLDSGLQKIRDLIEEINLSGISNERIYLLGFSQGACLALEYSARNAQRFGGVIGLSGGLIGDKLSPETYKGNFKGSPVFIGCSDVDFHIPLERVNETAQFLSSNGANVEKKIYPGMGHTVNTDEIEAIIHMIQGK